MYEFRVDYEDETTETVSVPALSIAEADATIRRDPTVVGTTLLASVDEKPQRCLITRALTAEASRYYGDANYRHAMPWSELPS